MLSQAVESCVSSYEYCASDEHYPPSWVLQVGSSLFHILHSRSVKMTGKAHQLRSSVLSSYLFSCYSQGARQGKSDSTLVKDCTVGSLFAFVLQTNCDLIFILISLIYLMRTGNAYFSIWEVLLSKTTTFLASAVFRSLRITLTKSKLFFPKFRDSSGEQKTDICRELNFEKANFFGASCSIMPEKFPQKRGCVFSTIFDLKKKDKIRK